MPGVLSAGLVGVTLLVGALLASPQVSPGQSLDARIENVFQSAYNLDQQQAIAAARAVVASSPGESRAHRALAAVLWFDLIFKRGTVTVDFYVGGLGGPARMLPKPPAELDAEFKQTVDKAIALAEERLRADPNDVQAKFDLGSAYGLQASYLASVEGSTTSAFMSARSAFNAQEDVLARDPKRSAAGVIVGTYRYMVSGLALPTRLFAYVAGFGGGKAEGIKLVEAASRDPASHVEAKTALAFIYSREGRHADAYRLLGELAAAFPRNRLFVLEQASAAIRAGRHRDADALLSAGLAALDHDTRPRMPNERALWLFKRGLARFGRDRRAESSADLQESLRSVPADWVRARAHLTLGKIADLDGRRPDAIAHYQQARQAGSYARDRAAESEATRLLSQPFVRRPVASRT